MGSLRDVVVNELVYDTVVSKFELQAHYYVHFWTKYAWESYELPYLPVTG